MLSLLFNRLYLNSRLSAAKGQEEYIILIFPIQKLKLRFYFGGDRFAKVYIDFS